MNQFALYHTERCNMTHYFKWDNSKPFFIREAVRNVLQIWLCNTIKFEKEGIYKPYKVWFGTNYKNKKLVIRSATYKGL